MDNLQGQYSKSFSGISNLYSEVCLLNFNKYHILVVGIGGVGSWACESLIRSGLTKFTLADLDEICLSNINRQVHSTAKNIGQSKVIQMKSRMLEINPFAEIEAIEDFITESNIEKLIPKKENLIVIDAIDGVSSKTALIAHCHKNSIPIIVTGAAGGKLNPTLIEVKDLADAENDLLLKRIRRKLRKEHSFPAYPQTFNIRCIYSKEKAQETCYEGDASRISCEGGLGSASFITGTFGFMAAAEVINFINFKESKACS